MNGAHLHLMLVHFPIAGTFFALALIVGGWLTRNETVKLVSLTFLVLVGLSVFAADKTGGLAARVLHDYPDVARDNIREHAMAADWAVRALGLNGLLAAYGLFARWKMKKLPNWLFIAVTVVTIWASTVVARVGYLGGQIRHPETRTDSVVPTPVATPPH